MSRAALHVVREEEFARTLAAVRQANGSAWDIADAVLADIGPPGVGTSHNGNDSRIRELSDRLLAEGFHYKPDTLRKYRNAAYIFPLGKRLPGASFAAHIRLIAHPDLLPPLVAQAKAEGRWLTVKEATRANAEAAHRERRERADSAPRLPVRLFAHTKAGSMDGSPTMRTALNRLRGFALDVESGTGLIEDGLFGDLAWVCAFEDGEEWFDMLREAALRLVFQLEAAEWRRKEG